MKREKVLELLWEAVKEPLREAAIAAGPVLAVYLKGVDAKWAAGAYGVIRLADAILHEFGKETGKKGLIKGLTRF